jgi:glycosyltransferase involved in cell wall biosynthesis
MKILIYISSLTSGGAEKVATLMANAWCNRYQITLLTDTPQEEDFFSIDPKVTRRSTHFRVNHHNLLQKVASHFLGLKQLREIVKHEAPDVIISHMDLANVRMLLATYGLKIPIIVEDHNNPKLKGMPQPWRLLKPFAYRQASYIVLLTKELLNYYPKSLYRHTKIRFIPNPLNIPKKIPYTHEVTLNHPTFIALGSLTDQKGFDILLHTFAEVVKQRPAWHLTILGEGKLRSHLEALSKELGIDKKVSMPGRVNHPYSVLKEAEVYVMSSRFEGFPVALCEALGVGVPSISFDCPTGPSDIINHTINGLLVDYLNRDKLAEAMIHLADNPALRKQLSHEAKKINETLKIDTIMPQWEALFPTKGCK